jgi:peroxiredoxin
MLRRMWLTVVLALLTASVVRADEVNVGDLAPDFPPGVFSDGKRYSLETYRGKVVVLSFHSIDFGRSTVVGEINRMKARYPDKPVVYLGVGAGRLSGEVQSFINSHKPEFPIFVDPLALMERQYGSRVRFDSVFIIDPEGKVAARSLEDKAFEDLLTKASWTYNKNDFPEELHAAVDALEYRRFEEAAKPLRTLRRNTKKRIAEPATKLWDDLVTQGNQWKEQAAASESTDPVVAFDQYTRLSSVFRGEALAEGVAPKLAALRKVAAVRNELSARTEFAKLDALILAGQNTLHHRAGVVELARSIADRFPDTATGQRAREIALNAAAMR